MTTRPPPWPKKKDCYQIFLSQVKKCWSSSYLSLPNGVLKWFSTVAWHWRQWLSSFQLGHQSKKSFSLKLIFLCWEAVFESSNFGVTNEKASICFAVGQMTWKIQWLRWLLSTLLIEKATTTTPLKIIFNKLFLTIELRRLYLFQFNLHVANSFCTWNKHNLKLLTSILHFKILFRTIVLSWIKSQMKE